jgi:hypothetical protein
MSPASNTSGAPLPSVAILGVDALLAARPATPVQLAHACQAAGYAAVYPVTWGDELLAAACVRRVAARGDEPAIFCACPHVSDALLEVGSDLARFLVPLVSPPVACARYLRALYGYNRVRITYIGACPGAHDPAIDARLTPMQFLGVLTQLDISLHEQPEVFESVLPPDRRRHRSIPGGAPAVEMLASEGTARTLVEIIDDDWKTELAQRLLSREPALFDVAASLGCHCAGARPGVTPAAARPSVVALEPPRASSDVIDPHVAVDVDRPLPVITARARELAPVSVAPVPTVEPGPAPDEPRHEPPAAFTSPPPAPAAPAAPAPAPPLASADPVVAADEEARRRKATAPVVARAAQTVPLARTEGGQVLPRAYAARRRTPSEAGVAVAPPVPDAVIHPAPDREAAPESTPEVMSAIVSPPEPVIEAVAPERVASEPVTIATATSGEGAPVEAATTAEGVATTDPVPPSPRATPRSVVVPIPAEELRPVPPPPAADHARTAIVATAATIALALVAVIVLRQGDDRVTSESSGIAVPVPTALDSLPPLTFPLPDTGTKPHGIATDTTAAPETRPLPDSTSATESTRIASVPPARSVRPTPARTRRRLPPIRRSRPDSARAAREASRRAADSVERDAIRRELEHRRARLDSIARALETPSGRPDR